MRTIPVGKNQYAIVDDEDYKRIRQYRWYCSNGYAVRRIEATGDKGATTISMQREVMRLPLYDPRTVRTKVKDRLDCRKENLIVRELFKVK